MDSKFLSPSCRLLPLLVLVVASALLLAANQAASQSGSPLSGTVTNEAGKPIAGVVVVGSYWKDCCPAERDSVRTDVNGDFRIDHPGAALHFLKEGFEPQTIAVVPTTTNLRVILHPANSDWIIPACGKPTHNLKRVRWSKYGIQFMIPRHAVKVAGGKPDVDYVRYVLRTKTGASYMELWFGGFTLQTAPDDDLIVASTGISQRNIRTASVNAPFVGVDSSGHLRSGGLWRWTAILGRGGGVYRNASAQDAPIFDQIINSMCFVPDPKR